MTAPYERPDVATWLARLPIFDGEHILLHYVQAHENLVVLDVGAGAGRLTAALRGSGCKYLALDPSLRQLRALQERHPDSAVLCADARAIPVATGSVDVVVMAFHVIEAILPGRERDRAIAEASRVLRPGGWLFFSHHVRWRYRPVEMTRQWLKRRVIAANSAVEFGDIQLTGTPATGGVSFDGLPMHIPAERALRAAAHKVGFLPRLRVPLTAVRGRWPASRLTVPAVVRAWEKTPTTGAAVSRWDENQAIAAIRDEVLAIESGYEDCTLVAPPDHHAVAISSDQINAAQRFPGEPLRSLVRRGIVEALSDLAAVGATPHGVQIDVRAPDNFNLDDFAAVGAAVNDTLRAHGGILLNGSNLSRGEFGISTTVIGYVLRAAALRRTTARPGDVVAVSGHVGGWNGALAVYNSGRIAELEPGSRIALQSAFTAYEPELVMGAALAATGLVTACIDCNDSLGKAAADLAMASRVRLAIDLARVPLAPAARIAGKTLGVDPTALAVAGVAGDDRLLFTVPEASLGHLAEQIHETCAAEVTVIGRVESGSGAVFTPTPSGDDLTPWFPESIYGPHFTME